MGNRLYSGTTWGSRWVTLKIPYNLTESFIFLNRKVVRLRRFIIQHVSLMLQWKCVLLLAKLVEMDCDFWPHQRGLGPSGGCGLTRLELVPYEPPANGIVHAVALRSTNPASWLSTNPALQGDGAEYSCWRDEYSHSDNQRAAQLMLISSSSLAVTTEPHQWTKRSKQQQQLCQLKRSEAYFNWEISFLLQQGG